MAFFFTDEGAPSVILKLHEGMMPVFSHTVDNITAAPVGDDIVRLSLQIAETLARKRPVFAEDLLAKIFAKHLGTAYRVEPLPPSKGLPEIHTFRVTWLEEGDPNFGSGFCRTLQAAAREAVLLLFENGVLPLEIKREMLPAGCNPAGYPLEKVREMAIGAFAAEAAKQVLYVSLSKHDDWWLHSLRDHLVHAERLTEQLRGVLAKPGATMDTFRKKGTGCLLLGADMLVPTELKFAYLLARLAAAGVLKDDARAFCGISFEAFCSIVRSVGIVPPEASREDILAALPTTIAGAERLITVVLSAKSDPQSASALARLTKAFFV